MMQKRHERREFARRQIVQLFVLRIRDRAEASSLIEPEHVRGAEHDAGTANAAHILLSTNTPCRIKNSPMKPFSVGSPIDDIVMIRKIAA